MFLNFFGNFKESRRLKAVFEGDITPRDGESPVIVYPEETNRQDLVKKLIRYYYLTDHQLPTGKIEAPLSKDLPELEHEYVLPIRKKISEVLVACRNRMREERRKKNLETALGGLLYAVTVFFPLWILCGFSTAGKILMLIDGIFALIALLFFLKSLNPRK